MDIPQIDVRVFPAPITAAAEVPNRVERLETVGEFRRDLRCAVHSFAMCTGTFLGGMAIGFGVSLAPSLKSKVILLVSGSTMLLGVVCIAKLAWNDCRRNNRLDAGAEESPESSVAASVTEVTEV